MQTHKIKILKMYFFPQRWHIKIKPNKKFFVVDSELLNLAKAGNLNFFLKNQILSNTKLPTVVFKTIADKQIYKKCSVYNFKYLLKLLFILLKNKYIRRNFFYNKLFLPLLWYTQFTFYTNPRSANYIGANLQRNRDLWNKAPALLNSWYNARKYFVRPLTLKVWFTVIWKNLRLNSLTKKCINKRRVKKAFKDDFYQEFSELGNKSIYKDSLFPVKFSSYNSTIKNFYFPHLSAWKFSLFRVVTNTILYKSSIDYTKKYLLNSPLIINFYGVYIVRKRVSIKNTLVNFREVISIIDLENYIPILKFRIRLFLKLFIKKSLKLFFVKKKDNKKFLHCVRKIVCINSILWVSFGEEHAFFSALFHAKYLFFKKKNQKIIVPTQKLITTPKQKLITTPKQKVIVPNWRHLIKIFYSTYSIYNRFNLVKKNKIQLQRKKTIFNNSSVLDSLFLNKVLDITIKVGKKKKAFFNILGFLNLLRRTVRNKRAFSKKWRARGYHYNFISIIRRRLNPRFYFKKFNIGRRILICPAPLWEKKKNMVAAKWFTKAAKQASKKKIVASFFSEACQIIRNRGNAIKFKQESWKLAKINKFNINMVRNRNF